MRAGSTFALPESTTTNDESLIFGAHFSRLTSRPFKMFVRRALS